MRKVVLLFIVILLSSKIFAQHSLKGKVSDTAGNGIPFTTVSLLHPEDSTLAFFSITNNAGEFDIKTVSEGEYLLQAAFMGFKTYYKPVAIPYKSGSFGPIILLPVAKQLEEVEITGEMIPILLKNDTVEYNAGAFKTKPDANVQELLKKMPGIQVDQSGNVKAQGEDVRKVLVDGKEFFGNDPKIATQNLPADAINKVQVFDKKSDAAEFTGIDDGSREKTINLMLKDGKKKGYFGDVTAGGGTDERYKLNGKLYKFKPTSQFALIGLLNNINEPGFSFQDYINFNGGFSSLMSGGGRINFQFDETAPIDFGQPVNGLIHSGAAGVNYSYEPRKNNRISVSYLGNGSDKKLLQQTKTQNFTDEGTFIRKDDADNESQNFAHRLNLNIRKDMDSVNQFTMAGGGVLTDSRSSGVTLSSSVIRDVVLNKLDSRTDDIGSALKGNANASYLRNTKGPWPVFKAGARISYDRTLSRTEWNNITSILPTSTIQADMQFQRDETIRMNYELNTSVMRSLGSGNYLEPGIETGQDVQAISRRQGIQQTEIFDSLSPAYSRRYNWMRPALNFSRSKGKKQLNLSVKAEISELSTELNNKQLRGDNYIFLLPSAEWQYQANMGRRFSVGYNSNVNTPEASQMLPVVNNANPIQKYVGNDALRPAYQHSVNANMIRFDQFNLSSFFVMARASYTADAISWSREINPDLTQSIMPVNVGYEYNVSGRVEYGRPIRPLGIKFNVSLDERYEQGINIVNKIDNISKTLTHALSLTIDNRKKEKLDVQIGGSVSISNASYSVYKDLNNTFYNFSGFGNVNYNPADRWNFSVGMDITQYNAQSFDKAVVVPIMTAEVSFYFLKGKKGTLSVYGFDLLNENQGIQRISELNYLRETTSNIIGRYVMLSFKYKLGKTGGGTGAVNNVDIKIRR